MGGGLSTHSYNDQKWRWWWWCLTWMFFYKKNSHHNTKTKTKKQKELPNNENWALKFIIRVKKEHKCKSHPQTQHQNHLKSTCTHHFKYVLNEKSNSTLYYNNNKNKKNCSLFFGAKSLHLLQKLWAFFCGKFNDFMNFMNFFFKNYFPETWFFSKNFLKNFQIFIHGSSR